MANFSNIEFKGVNYPLKDSEAREDVNALQTSIEELDGRVSALEQEEPERMQTLIIRDTEISERGFPTSVEGPNDLDTTSPVYFLVDNSFGYVLYRIPLRAEEFKFFSQTISVSGGESGYTLNLTSDTGAVFGFRLQTATGGEETDYDLFIEDGMPGVILDTYRDSGDTSGSETKKFAYVVDGAKAHKLARQNGAYADAWGSNIPDDMLITANGAAAICWELWNEGGPCLIAGTKITMQDFSKKNIEDIKVGDIVKSWNPTTKELCDAVVLVSQKTGEEEHFTNHIFEDGSNLITFADHGYYNPMFRYVRNIKNEKKNFHILNQNIEIKKCVVKTDYYISGAKVGRYNIVTSNNLYFANEVLCGDSPFRKYSFYVKHDVALPQEIRQICKADSDAYNEWNGLLNNPEYLRESADVRTRRVNAHEKELKARAELASLDYQTIKMAEGLLTQNEIAETLAHKEELRAVVNEQHALFVEAYNEVKEIELRYRGKTYDQLFRECCDRDNAAFEQFKAWLLTNKETEEIK